MEGNKKKSVLDGANDSMDCEYIYVFIDHIKSEISCL